MLYKMCSGVLDSAGCVRITTANAIVKIKLLPGKKSDQYVDCKLIFSKWEDYTVIQY
jgi:hypothetical protein